MKSKIIISILFGCILAGCTVPEHDNPKREYVEEYCPVCNGTGKVKASTSYKAAIAIPTLGHSFLIDEIACDKCGGDGILLRPVLRTDTIVQ